MDYVKKIKEFVEKEHKKPTSHYGYEPFEFHIIPTVKYARKLAKIFNADAEIVEISAWLHDIGSIKFGREDHHKTGAKVAEEELKKLNYPEDKIEQVKKCILNHRGSLKNNRESIEERILAEADVMSNFDDIAGIFKAAYIHEGLGRGEGRIAVMKKLENKWGQLHFPESKKIIEPKIKAARVLFSNNASD